MANVVMNKFKTENMRGNVNLASDTINVALINNIWGVSSSDQLDDLDYFSSISATWETTGTGYTAGGSALTGTAVVEDDTGNRGIFSASDVTWTTATVSAYGAALYRPSDSLLVCLIDFSGQKSSTSGDFKIQWNANGILNLT